MHHDTEIWQPVKGYEGIYEVSSRGAVRSLPRRQTHNAFGHTVTRNLKGRVLKHWIDSGGYKRVNLSRLGVVVDRSIHSLVATAFIGERPEGRDINHKDGNKLNNAVSNLEYTTRSENIAHAYATGLRGPSTPTGGRRATLTRDDALKIRDLGNYMTRRQLAAQFGVSPATIGCVLRGDTWK